MIIESHGKRLTGLASASPGRHRFCARIFFLSFTGPDRRILKVESYNKAPASEGPVAGQLAELGFVRDYPGMAYYSVLMEKYLARSSEDSTGTHDATTGAERWRRP